MDLFIKKGMYVRNADVRVTSRRGVIWINYFGCLQSVDGCCYLFHCSNERNCQKKNAVCIVKLDVYWEYRLLLYFETIILKIFCLIFLQGVVQCGMEMCQNNCTSVCLALQ